MSKPVAMYLPAKGVVRIKRGTWSEEIPVAALPRWIAFYRRQVERAKGRYSASFEPTLHALEAVQRKIEKEPT